MRRILLVVAVLAVWWPSASRASCGKCNAEQVTEANASKLLFGGSDSAGGIDDWYVTNGKVEAVIDDIGTVPTSLTGVDVAKTSSNAVETGGTLVDLGLYHKNSDQLPQSFNTGGLSLANVFLFRQGDETVWGADHNPCASVGDSDPSCAADTDCAAVTVYGIMLAPSISTRTAPTVFVRTRYQACNNENALQMRTEAWNQTGASQNLPIFDIFLWGGRGLVPFDPSPGHGFNHPVVDLSNIVNLLAVLTSTTGPYFVAPGNVDKRDGKMSRDKKVGEVSYGYKFDGGVVDTNGPMTAGGESVFIGGNADQIKAIHSSFLSAVTFGSVPGGPTVLNGQSVVSKRRLVLGKSNDVDSALGSLKNPTNIFGQIGYSTGTLKGSISPGSKSPGTVTFVRVGGSALSPAIANNSPVDSVRTKGGFKVQLPLGDYRVQVVVPGRDDVVAGPFTVSSGSIASTGAIPVPEKNGSLRLQVQDADTHQLIPAKISISPNPGMKREFEAFDYDIRTGMCSNNLATECVNDGDCGGGNTCFRTCNNKEPTACTSIVDCSGSEVCASDGRCRSHQCSSDADCESDMGGVGDTSASPIPPTPCRRASPAAGRGSRT